MFINEIKILVLFNETQLMSRYISFEVIRCLFLIIYIIYDLNGFFASPIQIKSIKIITNNLNAF